MSCAAVPSRRTWALAVALLSTTACASPPDWTPAEQRVLRSLSLTSLAPPPRDPSNRVADDPAAARLGAALFGDVRLSRSGRVSCASCHRANQAFTDGRALAQGEQLARRNTPAIVPAIYNVWQFWDGRADSLWAQALGPIEDPAEHGFSRVDVARVIARHHASDYARAFGPLADFGNPAALPPGASPRGDDEARRRWAAMTDEHRHRVNVVFANAGKAIAAFERTLRPARSRFDEFADEALERGRSAHLTKLEQTGLRLFIGKAQCLQCHSGPLFTTGNFFATAVPERDGVIDVGRTEGIDRVAEDEFNCLGPYSDAKPSDCEELRYMSRDGTGFLAAFKVPSLRNLARTAPYFHNGSAATLDGVIDHYVRAPVPPFPAHTDLRPVTLDAYEKAALVAFLKALDDEPAPNQASLAAR